MSREQQADSRCDNKRREFAPQTEERFARQGAEIRKDFPIFNILSENGEPIIYLDNAATSQKPYCVIEAERKFYERENANPLRGLYSLAEEATREYEEARKTVADFIGAHDSSEIIFTRNATEGLNLAAYCLTELLLKEGDEIAVSIMEHHSNLLPWQQAARHAGASLKFIECDENGVITDEAFDAAISEKTKILAMTHISNVLGCKNDLKKYSDFCRDRGIILVADGAQSVPHIPVNVKELGVDFLSFSGHKMFGPMGIGVLYGRKSLLEQMPPFLYGGEMIESVTRESAVYAQIPHKFEAGTVNAAGAAALAEAVRYIKKTGFDTIQEREHYLTEFAMKRMKQIPGINIIGSPDAAWHNGIISFTLEGVHPHDVASILDADRIGVRAGHHCAQPLLAHLGIPSCTRVSLAFYNTCEEIELFADSLSQIRRKMGYGE